MSLASTIVADFDAVGSFFSGAFAKLQAANAGSANAQTVQSAATAVASASSAVQGALPALADEGVNLALSVIPEGEAFAPIADEFIDLLIAGLTAKKSTATS